VSVPQPVLDPNHTDRGEIAGTVIRLIAYLGTLAVIAIVFVQLLPVGESAALVAMPQKSHWMMMDRPHPAYAVSFPDIADPHAAYVVMRSAGGGRKDIATLEGPVRGFTGTAGRSARVEIYRPGSEFAGFGAPEDEIAARVASIGKIEAATAAPAIESRFGPLALINFTLVQGGIQRGCLGFVGRVDQPRLQISGWFCNAGPELVARTPVACGIDRLTLLSAGNDPKLAEFFANAELKAPACNARQTRAGTGSRTADWPGGRQEVRLRGADR
jgi:hypothetical protein